jgi:hypothetical protein
MPRKRSRAKTAGPLLMAELALASMQTIAARTRMMALGTCTPAEYRRMVQEKLRAAQLSTLSLMRGRADPAALLAPWHARARRNAKRLRK